MRVKVLSPQEERIEKNKGKVVFFKDPDEREKNRIEKIFESFENSKSSVDVQRARYFTESFKSTEGQTLSLRWAKALYHFAEKIDIIIDDNNYFYGDMLTLIKVDVLNSIAPEGWTFLDS